MIIILAIFLTTVFAQQEKYIELLSDDDKQEFLDKVARMIMESVKGNVTNKNSKELNDEQLNAQNSYVQDILKQEAVAFKTQRRQRYYKNSEEGDKIKNLKESTLDHETVIQDVKIKNTTNVTSKIFKSNLHNQNSSKSNVLQSITASSRQEVDNVSIKIATAWLSKGNNQPFSRSQEPMTDQPYFVPVYKYSPRFAYYNNKNRLGPNEAEKSKIELETQLRERNNKIYNKTKPSEFVLQLNNELRKFGKFKRKKTTTEAPPPTQHMLEEDNKENKKIDDESENKNQIIKILINFSIQFITNFLKPFSIKNHSSENYESTHKESSGCETSEEGWNDDKKKGRTIRKILKNTDKNSFYTILKRLQALIYHKPSMRSKVEPKVNVKKVLEDLIVTDKKSLTQYDHLTTIMQVQTALSQIFKLVKRIKQSKQLNTADLQLLKYILFLHNRSLELKKENNKLGNKLKKKVKLLPKNTLYKAKTGVSITVHRQVYTRTTTPHNTAEVNTATTENYRAVTKDRSAKGRLKIRKKLKHGLELQKKSKFRDNEIKATNKRNAHLNHYQVYEIPWLIRRKNQPFFRSQEVIKDQPYYVPVYKYSPNFAYYNPENRLRLNEVEENSIELDTSNLREGNDDVYDKDKPNEFILQLNNEMRKFIHVFKWNETFTSTTTTTIAPEPWDFLINPFANRQTRRTTTYAPRTPLKNRRKRRSTTTLAPKTYSYTHMSCESCENTDIETSNEGVNTVKDLSVKNKTNIFIDLGTLPAFKIPLRRSKVATKVNIFMNVLKDLILKDSKSLKQYDWLTTTVQIQSMLTKILKLIKRMQQSEQLNPADLQVLKYMAFLHNFSLEVIKENNKVGQKLRKKYIQKNTFLKDKRFLNRVWQYLRTPLSDLAEKDGLSILYEFLIDVQDGLFDLHEAIRHIADVTKFDRQNWYGNLKQVYLSVGEKHLRELLLHISVARLVDLVEHSCQQDLDLDFIQFVETNKNDAERIVEEFIFINDVTYKITINKE